LVEVRLPADRVCLAARVQNILLSHCVAKTVDHASMPGSQTDVESHAATAQIWATLAVAIALDNIADAIRDAQQR